MPARARTPVLTAALALVLFAVVGRGLVNYDALYSLVWGRDLVLGRGPELELPLAPTPHPLTTLLGALATPLGADGAQALTLVVAFLALAALGVVVARLGAHWFGPAAGIVAAAILLTRRPVLDFGARAYLDVPYLVLLLSAVLVEARTPRDRARTVLVLVGLAGLLRPEAWLFAGLYVLWRRRFDLVWLAAAAPVIWVLHDLALTGDPLHSLTGTRATADVLQRVTGLDDVPLTVPRRLGEILREPVLLGAAGGLVLTVWQRRPQALQAVALAGVALAAFCVLAAAGLPILGRYLLLPATVGALLCGAALTGWRDATGPARRPWMAVAAVTALALVAFAPGQVDRITALRDALRVQDAIQDDLHALTDSIAEQPAGCRPVAVPNFRPVPLLALWLDEEPTAVTPDQDAPLVVTIDPARAPDYVLDRRDLRQSVPAPPRGGREVARRGPWRLDSSCG